MKDRKDGAFETSFSFSKSSNFVATNFIDPLTQNSHDIHDSSIAVPLIQVVSEQNFIKPRSTRQRTNDNDDDNDSDMYKLRSKRQPQPTSSTAAVSTAKALPAPALATTADDDNDYDDDDNNDASTSKDMQIGNRGVVKANSPPRSRVVQVRGTT